MAIDVMSYPAVVRPRTTSLPARIALCFVEARLVVQVVFCLRLLAGVALSSSADIAVSPLRLLCVVVVWELAVMSVYLFDGVMDVIEDRLNGSKRPIARGDLSRGFATTVTACTAASSLLGGFLLGAPYNVLVPVMLVLGYAYCAPPIRLKRWSGGAGMTVTGAGLLTFLAGSAVDGAPQHGRALIVLAVVMSLWMGLVGALVKDFSDIEGDTAAGCYTAALTRHSRAVRLVIANALGIAIAFGIAAAFFVPMLRLPSLIMAIGALCVVVTTLGVVPTSSRSRRRRPYHAFMLAQYGVLASVLANAVPLLV
jgi:4-hydroxybenzoate polyprenyltransferase